MVLRPKFQESHVDAIRSFIRHHAKESGRDLLVGMSGGVDSSLVAKLCADAVGPQRVLGLSLPEVAGRSRDEADARAWARELGIAFRTIPIGPMVRAIAAHLEIPARDRVRLGNVKARVRMITWYHVAHKENRVVMGAGNKSEIATGYHTRWGDSGVDFLPIGDLYKTQVRAMARHLGVPQRIVEKVPSAGLWPGQTDEGELGISYEELDGILLGIELQYRPEEIAERADVPLALVRRIVRLVEANAFKRKMPLIPKLGVRTFGLDWRE